MRIYLYIAIAAGVSFLIRVLPLTLIRKQITNPFLRSFLYYVPYVTLAVMTFPAIVEATQSPLAGAQPGLPDGSLVPRPRRPALETPLRLRYRRGMREEEALKGPTAVSAAGRENLG